MTPAAVSSGFKSYVAETLRMQAQAHAHQNERAEAARKLREARRLERQVKDIAHVR